jgi:hypothetical protein
MKLIPFSVIKAAKENDLEAAEKIRKHYDSYIGSRCLQSYTDEAGTRHTYVDEDLRYLAEIALYAAIFRFQFTDPPDDFEP